MTTIDIPAPYVPYLKSAEIYTLAEEADRVRDGEADVRSTERWGRNVDVAKADLARPFLDRMIAPAEQIDNLPADRDEPIPPGAPPGRNLKIGPPIRRSS